MNSRTHVCQHESRGCLQNCFKNVVSYFYYSYIASNLLQAVPLLIGLKFKKLVDLITSKNKIKDSCKFALFVTVFNLVYKSILCVTRRLVIINQRRQNKSQIHPDKICAPIAGFCAGITLLLDSKFRREFIAVIALSRFMETSINLAEEKQ